MANKSFICKKSDVQPGSLLSVEVEGEELVVYEIEGEYRAIHGVCPHKGHPLAEAHFDGCMIICPFHFWKFDAVSNAGLWPQYAPSLKAYPIIADGADLYIELSS